MARGRGFGHADKRRFRIAGCRSGLNFSFRVAFIGGLFVPMVPFVVWLLWRERPSRENVMGVVCASLGGALMVWPRPSATASGADSSRLNSGDALTLAATLLFALHVALTSHYARRIATHRLSVCQIAVAAGVFVLLWLACRAAAPLLGLNEASGGLSAFVASEAGTPPWNARVAAQILYLALVATVGTFLVGTWGQARVGATHAVVIFRLEPVLRHCSPSRVARAQRMAHSAANRRRGFCWPA